MEENTEHLTKKPRSPLVLIIISILLALSTAGFATWAIILLNTNNVASEEAKPEVEAVDFGTYRIEKFDGEPYYIFQDDYSGEYNIQTLDLLEYFATSSLSAREALDQFKKNTVVSYNEYLNFCELWGLEPKFSNANQKYALVSDYFSGANSVSVELAEVNEEGHDVWLYYHAAKSGYVAGAMGYVIVVPVSRSINNTVLVSLYNETEYSLIKNPLVVDPIDDDIVVKKPVIYLYPEEETEVQVRLGFPENITVSYPNYGDGWNVIAQPGGELKDVDSGRSLYALYYEGEIAPNTSEMNEGFVVKGADTAEFLEEKLAILGLTEREAEEFIVYWLPVLQANKYNYIRFENYDFIDSQMPLLVSPTPDNVIRVWMAFKGLDVPIEVSGQELETPSRDGFTVVEWGGTEL